MKKKVRIYKQGGEGKFINKTAQFLYKAQEGGSYDPNTMGYPGSDQQAQQQTPLNDNQLSAIVIKDISNRVPKEAIVMKLVTAHGKDPLQANQLVDQMYVYLENEREKEKANAEDDDEYENTDVAPVEETAMAPVQEIEEGFYGDDQNTDMANEIAMEDSEVDDDDSEIESDIIMRHGGLHKSQDGDAVDSELWNTENNQVEFPGIESYMPQSYVDMYGNTNESIAARAWQEPTETEEVVNDTSYTEPAVDPSTLKKGGTYKTNKRNFVKSILGLVKKQIGGEEETSSNSPDPTGQDVRTNNLNSFLGVLKNQSKLAIAEEEANQYYDEQQQTPMAEEGGDMENPMHHLQLYSNATRSIFNDPQNIDVRAQNGIEVGTNFGNLSNRQQRQLGRLYRSIGNNVSQTTPIYNNRAGVQLPQLGGYSVGPLTKFEVTRSGVLGNPRRYSMNFGPSTGQGIGSGVGSTKATVIKSNKVIAANIINNIAIKEVATTTPTAATTTAATWQNDGRRAEKDAANTADNAYWNYQANYVSSGIPDSKLTPGIFENRQFSSPVSESDYNKVAKKIYKKDGFIDWPLYDKLSQEEKDIIDQASYLQKDSKGNEYSVGADYNNPEAQVEQNKLELDKKIKTGLLELNQRFNLPGRNALLPLTGVNTVTKPVASTVVKPKVNNSKLNLEVPMFPKTQFVTPSISTFGTRFSNQYGLEEDGGFVDSSQMQPGVLQKFVSGGDDEEQIDYNNSIDTTDPYFQRGGRVRAGLGNAMRSLGQLLPVNLPSYAGSYDEVGQAYDPNTGKLVNPAALGNQLTEYKVTKSGLISGRPKRYTMYFNGAEKPVLPESGLNSDSNLNKALTVKETKELTLQQRNELARNPDINQGGDRWSRKDRRVENRMIRQANKKGFELAPYDLNRFTDDEQKEIAPVVEYIEDSEREPNIVSPVPVPPPSLNEEDYMDQIFRDQGLELNTKSVTNNTVNLKPSIQPENVNTVLDNKVSSKPSINQEEVNTILDNIDKKEVVEDENFEGLEENPYELDELENENEKLTKVYEELSKKLKTLEGAPEAISEAIPEEVPEEDINNYVGNNNLSFNQPTMLDTQDDIVLDDNAADYYKNSLNLEANAAPPGPISTVENKPIRTYSEIENQAFQDSLTDYTNEYNPLREDFDEQRTQKIRDYNLNYIKPISLEDAWSTYYNPYLEELNNQKLEGVPKKATPKVAPKVAPKVKSNVVVKNPYPKGNVLHSVFKKLPPEKQGYVVRQDAKSIASIEAKKNNAIQSFKALPIKNRDKLIANGDYVTLDRIAGANYYDQYITPAINALKETVTYEVSKINALVKDRAAASKAVKEIYDREEAKIKKLKHDFYKSNNYATIGVRFLGGVGEADANKFRVWLNKTNPSAAKDYNLDNKGGLSGRFWDAYEQYGPKYLYQYQLGGSLNKFLPQAEDGSETPINFFNPTIDGNKDRWSRKDQRIENRMTKQGNSPELDTEVDTEEDILMPPITKSVDKPVTKSIDKPVDLVTNTNGLISGLEPKSYWADSESFNTNPQGNLAQPIQYNIDPLQQDRQNVKPPAPYAQDIKVKNQTEVDNEALLQLGNAGVEGVLGAIDKRQNLKRERPMYDNLSADNLYAAKTTKDRGDYVASGSGTGLFRPDEQGQVWNSRSKQYGGESYEPDYSSIENNIYESTFEDGGFYEDDETYMTQDQIDQYLAAGGEIEYI